MIAGGKSESSKSCVSWSPFLNGRINSMINSADEDDSVRGKSQQCKRDRANTQMKPLSGQQSLGSSTCVKGQALERPQKNHLSSQPERQVSIGASG